MKTVIIATILTLISCSPLKRATVAVQQAGRMRDEVAATIHIPKDSIYIKRGIPVETIKRDTVNNTVIERYYTHSVDTIHKVTFDSEKTDALQRMYFLELGNSGKWEALYRDGKQYERNYLIVICALIGIIIINAKFKFL